MRVKSGRFLQLKAHARGHLWQTSRPKTLGQNTHEKKTKTYFDPGFRVKSPRDLGEIHTWVS